MGAGRAIVSHSAATHGASWAFARTGVQRGRTRDSVVSRGHPLGAVIGVVCLYEYQSASDLFEAAREAAEDAERIGRDLGRAAAACGLRGHAPTGTPGGRGGASDPMAPVDRFLDQEARTRRRLEEDYALIDLACGVIYGRGQDGRGGVCALLGPATADALWWRYCGGVSWAAVSRHVGMSERWCIEATAAALDVVDGYGWQRVAEGVGTAET